MIGRPLVAAQVAGAFVVLCLVSSATYLVNDVRDASRTASTRASGYAPVAAGELAPRTALRVAAVLAVVGHRDSARRSPPAWARSRWATWL